MKTRMKTRVKTIKGFANSETFEKNLNEFINSLNGFKELTCFETLKSKKASEKVVIKAWYWHGEWSDPTKEIYAIYYR
jgi:hypothetical protein